jgi:hypothetical protein
MLNLLSTGTTLPYHEDAWGLGGIATILDLRTRFRRVVSFTPLAFYPREGTLGTQWVGWMGLKACMDVVEKRRILP